MNKVNKQFSPGEKRIFDLLKAQVNYVVSRSMLEDALYTNAPRPQSPYSNVLQVLIRRIRRKLPAGHSIHTARNVGYKLEIKPLCDRCQAREAVENILVEGFLPVLICAECKALRVGDNSEAA